MISKDDLIVITGAAGFIGSCLTGLLNREGFFNLVLVDAFGDPEKAHNLKGKVFTEQVEREYFFEWLASRSQPVKFIFHIGARTDTTEFDYAVHQHLNVEYSQKVWNYCCSNSVPVVYASSAATYGSGEHGYNDNHEVVNHLQPLNPYGISKNEFDKWALKQNIAPPCWAGLTTRHSRCALPGRSTSTTTQLSDCGERLNALAQAE